MKDYSITWNRLRERSLREEIDVLIDEMRDVGLEALKLGMLALTAW